MASVEVDKSDEREPTLEELDERAITEVMGKLGINPGKAPETKHEEATGEGEEETPAPEPEEKPAEPEKPGEGEEKGPRAVSPWMTTQDVRDIVASIPGMTMEDLVPFQSEEEFIRALKFVDRQFGRRAERLGEQPAAQQSPVQSEEPKGESPKAVEQSRDERGRFLPPDETPFKVALDPQDFPEELGKQIQASHDHLANKLAKEVAELKAQLQDQGAQLKEERSQRAAEFNRRLEQQFDNLVDGLGHDALFGKSENLKAAELENRKKLFGALAPFLDAAAYRRQAIRIDRGMILRGLNLAFSDELDKQKTKALHDRLRAQDKRRLGSGESKPAAGRRYSGPIDRETGEIDPELLALGKKILAEQG